MSLGRRNIEIIHTWNVFSEKVELLCQAHYVIDELKESLHTCKCQNATKQETTSTEPEILTRWSSLSSLKSLDSVISLLPTHDPRKTSGNRDRGLTMDNPDMRKHDEIKRENSQLRTQVDECKILLRTITTASRKLALAYAEHDDEGLFDLVTENIKVMSSILNGNVTWWMYQWCNREVKAFCWFYCFGKRQKKVPWKHVIRRITWIIKYFAQCCWNWPCTFVFFSLWTSIIWLITFNSMLLHWMLN